MLVQLSLCQTWFENRFSHDAAHLILMGEASVDNCLKNSETASIDPDQECSDLGLQYLVVPVCLTFLFSKNLLYLD